MKGLKPNQIPAKDELEFDFDQYSYEKYSFSKPKFVTFIENEIRKQLFEAKKNKKNLGFND